MLGVKYVIGTLIGIALNLYITLSSMAILMMLILPIHEHGTCSYLFLYFLFPFNVLCSFLSTGLLPPWLGLFLGTLFFLLLCQMGFFSPDFCFGSFIFGIQEYL